MQVPRVKRTSPSDHASGGQTDGPRRAWAEKEARDRHRHRFRDLGRFHRHLRHRLAHPGHACSTSGAFLGLRTSLSIAPKKMIGKEPAGSVMHYSIRGLRRCVSITVIARAMPFMTSSCIFSRSSPNIEIKPSRGRCCEPQIPQTLKPTSVRGRCSDPQTNAGQRMRTGSPERALGLRDSQPELK